MVAVGDQRRRRRPSSRPFGPTCRFLYTADEAGLVAQVQAAATAV